MTISLIPLFGMGWFIPRLPSFVHANPQTEINVVYANHRNYLSDARICRFARQRAVGGISERKADFRQNGGGMQPGVYPPARTY
nr:Uncharacterised protein [Raoultella sp. NCTC 9187]